MNKNSLKIVFDEIKSDVHSENRLKYKVKSGVLSKKTNKNAEKIALSLTALCTVIAIIFSIGIFKIFAPNGNSSAKKTIATGNLTIMKSSYNSDSEKIFTPLEHNKKSEFKTFLFVKITKNLSAKEKNKEIKKLNNQTDEILAQKPANWNYTHCTRLTFKENAILSTCSLNAIKLDIKDSENLKEISIENKSLYGSCILIEKSPRFDKAPASPITLEAEKYDIKSPEFYYSLNLEKIYELYTENINTPFSTFNDEITFTVKYKSGEICKSKISLTFNENGTTDVIQMER